MTDITKTAVATYIGRRMTTKNKLAYFWKIEGQTPGGFAKQIASASIGEKWQLSLVGDSIHINGPDRPKQLPDQPLDPDAKEYEALDAGAMAQWGEIKAKKVLAGRQSEFDRAMLPLISMLRTLRFRDDEYYFIERVKAALYKARS